MIHKIENIEDVAIFFTELFNEGVSAHPDDDFNDYINYETKEATYTIEEAMLRNELMNSSFIICEKANADIYELMFETYSNESKRINNLKDI
jgi:hypothetical protein